MPGELRRARACVGVAFGVCGAAFATWAARVPAVQHRLGLTPGQLAIALFGLAAGSVLALAGSGALITRAGSRAGAVAGSAVLCVGLALVPAAGSLPFFVAALVVLGAGNGLLDVSMNAHAARVELAYGRSIFIAEGTVNDWSAVYLRSVAAAPPALASLGCFAFSVAMIVVRLVADRLVARVGAARLIRLAAVTAMAGLALVISVPAPAAVIAGFAVTGLGVAVVPLAWSAAARRQPRAPGRAIAGVATLGYLGFLLGPVLIGGLAGLAGLRLALIAAVAVTGAVYFLAPALA